ncbi:MAG: MFS transporter [Candidatus Heimdallarchaeota archaeon]|nr:MFS transporter [Candidatus Heimdallarchaeota archaeon]
MRIKDGFQRFFPPRNLLPLLFSRLFDSLAGTVTGTFFAVWLNNELINSYTILAVILTTPSILSVISTSLLSAHSDKTGKRKELMVLSRIALMVQYFFLLLFQQSIWGIFSILVIMGLVTQVYYVMSDTLATSICPVERRGEMASFQLFFSAAGGMIGSGIASSIYDHLTITGSFGFGIGFAFLACLFAFFSTNASKSTNDPSKTTESPVILSETVGKEKPEEILSSKLIKERVVEMENSASYKSVLRNPQLIWIFVVTAILSFGVGPFGLIPIVYMENIVGLTNLQISIAGTLATLVGMITLLIVGKSMDKVGRKPFFLFSHVFYPLYFALYLFLGNHPLAIITLWVLPIYPFRGPSTTAMVADLTEEKNRAKAMNILLYVQSFSVNIGGIIGCIIADYTQIGLKIVPLFPAMVTMLSATIAYFTIKETKKKPAKLQLIDKTFKVKFRW